MSVQILKDAAQYCDENGLRNTQTRQLVLGIVAEAKKPITAYQILEALKPHIKNPKPPIVYRATDFWQEHYFIHKIESLNAFMVCREGHQHSGSQYMICNACGDVTEIHLCSMPDNIANAAKKSGFTADFCNLELHGRCKTCF